MRTLKRIFFSLIILAILLVSSSVAYVYYKQDDLEQKVINEVNKQLKSPVKIGDIKFSAIKHFPFITLEFKNVVALDVFQQDTLCNISLIQIDFNALDLYNKIYIIENLILEDGFVSVYYKNNVPNYEIWSSTNDSASGENIDFGLQNILLNNFNIAFSNSSLDAEIFSLKSELKLNIKNGETNLDIVSTLQNKKLILNKINHLANTNINLNAQVNLDSVGFDIQSNIDVAKMQLDLRAKQINETLSLNLNTSELDLKSVFKIVPKTYLTALEGYNISGKSKAQLSLINDQQKEAGINVNFTLKEGYFASKDLPFDLNQISLKGKYTNGKQRSNKSTTITLEDIALIANDEAIQANAVINNLDNPNIKTDFKSQLQLSELEKWGYKVPLQSLVGEATLSGSYNGKIGVKNKATYDIAMAEKTAEIRIKNLTIINDENTPKLSNATLNMRLINDHLDITAFNGILAKESKINFVGAAENVFSYLFLKNAHLKIGGNLESDWMIVDELISSDTSSKNEVKKPEPIRLPNNIIANLNINLIDLTFERFHMRNFKTKISYKDRLFKAKNIELETMSGKITSNLTFEQIKNGKIRLISTTLLDDINVRQLFYEFHNFGQTTMRHKHLKGKINSEIYLRNEWDEYFNNISENLYSFIDVKINNGELLDFEPLMMMSDYISVEELKRIKFSTLENQIEIKNNLIDIPFMEIHSTAIDIAGAGTHSFDNEMDYEFKILLNEILGNKLKRKNKKTVSEFGKVRDDGAKGMTMFLKMEGTVDEPKISPNTFRLRESLGDGFKKEKKELKEVIKNQFGDTKNDQHIQDNPDYDNTIEWEE